MFWSLDVVDHCEDALLVDGDWVFVGVKDAEADTLQDTRNALARVDFVLVETDENALEVQDLFAVFQQFDEVLTRQFGWKGILGQEKS